MDIGLIHLRTIWVLAGPGHNILDAQYLVSWYTIRGGIKPYRGGRIIDKLRVKRATNPLGVPQEPPRQNFDSSLP